jgi:hypothetical protein
MNQANIDRAKALAASMRAAGFAGAIVAGGFLRDSILGFEPKDIDVFIAHDPSRDYVAELSKVIGQPVRIQVGTMYSTSEVVAVFTTEGDCPIQVIELDGDPTERAKHHDFGICQVWHDGTNLCTTGHFEFDRLHERCTLIHCESADEHARSMRRWERLKDKLVGFTLVDKTQWAAPF